MYRMKKHIALWLAGLIIGVILFLVFYKIFRVEYGISLSIALGATVSGILVEYLKPLLNRKHNRNTES